MKTAMRIIMTFFAFIATYYFIYWVPLSLIPAVRKVAMLPTIIALLIAITIAVAVWKGMRATSHNLAYHILMGGIIVGAIGFVLGFFGPIIFNFGGNQGPLLGLFFTGPIGFILGLIAGAVYWKVKAKGHATTF